MQNSDKLSVLFLWHHHQPFYLAPDAEIPLMPWVRLHSVRGYLDMLAIAKLSKSKMCFNFSASLIEQLKYAESSEICDEFERISQIPARELSESEKKFVLTNFFSVNWNVHIKSNPRYFALLAKRGENSDDISIKKALTEFSFQDYTDLITLFNLVWIGFEGRKAREVKELFQKATNYSYQDIEQVLVFHHQAIAQIIPGYKSLQDESKIEISTSPYAHPILPLLCDTMAASPDIPKQNLPSKPFQYPQDATRHLNQAAEVYHNIWGRKQRGLWPSEGSVSHQALELAIKAGFQWAATDQAILERSQLAEKSSTAHFGSFDYKNNSGTLKLYFRDHGLSDAIGFRYSAMKADQAIKEFVGNLENIEKETRKNPNRCVVIALDGENPWEGYSDGGEQFLTKLFETIEKNSVLTTATFSEHSQISASGTIKTIHAGSWIDSNFKIWVGDSEKNQAWTELLSARETLDGLLAGHPNLDQCFYWLMRAQCSDWMWWYGDPFSTPYESHYDELFRSYLKAVYVSAKLQYPSSLDIPITSQRRPERRLQPTFPIAPILDGKKTSYFEWIGACKLDPRQFMSAMNNSERVIESIFYGFGENELFFRLDFIPQIHKERISSMVLNIIGEHEHSFAIPFVVNNFNNDEGGFCWFHAEILEIALKFERASIKEGGECQFWIDINAQDANLERLPPQGVFRFQIPTKESLSANWIV